VGADVQTGSLSDQIATTTSKQLIPCGRNGVSPFEEQGIMGHYIPALVVF
jgi:hypothetical protein